MSGLILLKERAEKRFRWEYFSGIVGKYKGIINELYEAYCK